MEGEVKKQDAVAEGIVAEGINALSRGTEHSSKGGMKRHDAVSGTIYDNTTHCNTLQHTATHCNTLDAVAKEEVAQLERLHARNLMQGFLGGGQTQRSGGGKGGRGLKRDEEMGEETRERETQRMIGEVWPLDRRLLYKCI